MTAHLHGPANVIIRPSRRLRCNLFRPSAFLLQHHPFLLSRSRLRISFRSWRANLAIRSSPRALYSPPSILCSVFPVLLAVYRLLSILLVYLVVTPNPLGDLWGWHFQHLTILTLAMTLLAFVLGILADLTLSARLFYLKNILAVVAAPLEFCVTVLYWGIRSIDPMLLLHPDSPMPPVIVDHSFHTFPTLLCLLDLLLLSPPWTLTFIPSLGLAGALAAAYWFWVEACAAHNNGVYAYPLFGLLDTWSRVQVFVGAAVIFSVAVVILGSLQTWANGSLKVVNGVSRGEDERPGHIKGE
ncbi:putative integral membrane protein [Phyllosticta citrichinensis]|uniref:Integral membrane protein n=1 Tax=Phyllosticta citrichinensis TaxID=1130410 RepID=A0ABR1Y3D7_9PEZI